MDGPPRPQQTAAPGPVEERSTAAGGQSHEAARCGAKDAEHGRSTMAEDAARLRLMEIARVAPPDDLLGPGVEGSSPKEPPSLPRVDSGEEIRRKLITISYAEIDRPTAETPQPARS